MKKSTSFAYFMSKLADMVAILNRRAKPAALVEASQKSIFNKLSLKKLKCFLGDNSHCIVIGPLLDACHNGKENMCIV